MLRRWTTAPASSAHIDHNIIGIVVSVVKDVGHLRQMAWRIPGLRILVQCNAIADDVAGVLGQPCSILPYKYCIREARISRVDPNRCRRSTEALGQLVVEEEERVRHQVMCLTF